MKKRSFSNKQLVEAVKLSTSTRQVLRRLKLKQAGGNYQTIRKTIQELQLDTSHFTGQGWASGKQLPSKRPIEEYLTNKQPIQSYKLKNRLLKEGVFPQKCSNCNRKTWLGKPIPLELDHRDGNTENNNLNNLHLICPNCHVFTPNYRGKNKGKYS